MLKELAGKCTQFLREAYSELSKATWLSRKEVIQSTILILIVVAVVAVYVNIIDLGLTKLIAAIL